MLDRFQSGWTIAVEIKPDEDPFAHDRKRGRIERAVIDLISEPRESPLVERRWPVHQLACDAWRKHDARPRRSGSTATCSSC